MKKIPRATWQRAKDHPGELARIPSHRTYSKDPRMERCNRRQFCPIPDRQPEIWPTTIWRNLRIPADKTFATKAKMLISPLVVVRTLFTYWNRSFLVFVLTKKLHQLLLNDAPRGKLAWRAKNAGSSKFSSYFHPFWGFVPLNEKKQRDQLAASRFKSENWEGETGSSGRTNFLRSGHVVFFFVCTRNVIGLLCMAPGILWSFGRIEILACLVKKPLWNVARQEVPKIFRIFHRDFHTASFLNFV